MFIVIFTSLKRKKQNVGVFFNSLGKMRVVERGVNDVVMVEKYVAGWKKIKK